MDRMPTIARMLEEALPQARANHAQPPVGFHEGPPPSQIPASAPAGIKQRTVATTVYLLPADHLRLRTMAIARNVSFQTLVLDALDRLLTEERQPLVGRWETRRRKRERIE
jgi:hypothetical protein